MTVRLPVGKGVPWLSGAGDVPAREIVLTTTVPSGDVELRLDVFDYDGGQPEIKPGNSVCVFPQVNGTPGKVVALLWEGQKPCAHCCEPATVKFVRDGICPRCGGRFDGD